MFSPPCPRRLPQQHYFRRDFCTTKLKNKGNTSSQRSRLGRVFVPAFSKGVRCKHSIGMHLKAGEGIRTLDFHVGNMPWLSVWRYQKRGFALHIWSVLHYKTPIRTPIIDSHPLPNWGSLLWPIRQVQSAESASQSWPTWAKYPATNSPNR
jgi:hypothetical protein